MKLVTEDVWNTLEDYIVFEQFRHVHGNSLDINWMA